MRGSGRGERETGDYAKWVYKKPRDSSGRGARELTENRKKGKEEKEEEERTRT